MDPAQQIADIKARSTAFVTTTQKQAQGGFIVQGQIQYVDNDTKGVLMAENAEGVATSAQQAMSMSLNYAQYGRFEAPAQQAFSTLGGAQQADLSGVQSNAQLQAPAAI